MEKNEINKVINWLDKNKIKYEHIVQEAPKGTKCNRNQILIKPDDFTRLSIICHYGSYGYEQGLLEYWDFEMGHEVEGYLTAKDVIKILKKELKK